MQLWFWLTPIFVFEESYPEKLQFLLDYNPMAFLVRAYRDLILPGRNVDPDELFILLGWSLAAFLAGGLTFRHLKRGFADVL
jgi:ABC-type polysaccharide/polyol phosphate export permease